MRWSVIFYSLVICLAFASNPNKPKKLEPITCQIVKETTAGEPLGAYPFWNCGKRAEKLYFSPQSHVSNVRLTLEVFKVNDFMEDIVFEDETKKTGKIKEQRSMKHELVLNSKNYRSLYQYIKHTGDIIVEENPKVYKELHEEIQNALKSDLSNYNLRVHVHHADFDPQTPVFRNHPPAFFNEWEVYTIGKDGSLRDNPNFMGLLSSKAKPGVIVLEYFQEDQREDIQFEKIAVKLQPLHIPFISYHKFIENTYMSFLYHDPVDTKMSDYDYILDILENHRQLKETGHEMKVKVAYCYALVENNVNSRIQYDLWLDLQRRYSDTDCLMEYIPMPFIEKIAEDENFDHIPLNRVRTKRLKEKLKKEELKVKDEKKTKKRKTNRRKAQLKKKKKEA